MIFIVYALVFMRPPDFVWKSSCRVGAFFGISLPPSLNLALHGTHSPRRFVFGLFFCRCGIRKVWRRRGYRSARTGRCWRWPIPPPLPSRVSARGSGGGRGRGSSTTERGKVGGIHVYVLCLCLCPCSCSCILEHTSSKSIQRKLHHRNHRHHHRHMVNNNSSELKTLVHVGPPQKEPCTGRNSCTCRACHVRAERFAASCRIALPTQRQ